ncbi:MAG: hypothetical protein KKF46_02835 [Nanoarchaeota archaeon]|nr:hypothetical protein [Nanoarchaeota archaeon]MBU1321268.1 hypothetical protein [Nanoarchaeota archaeon]MBU1597339.1 hypothetical protein [Nanoarchaeota archaeon]MBU2441462.1 hypothetical protein [Nanoarchaeota archaeon]
MVTISQITKKIIESRPTLQEALIEDVISFANLAEKLQPRIEKEIGHKVKASAINMSIRRYAETLRKKIIIPKTLKLTSELIMKTNLCDVTITKSPSALDEIKELHKLVDYKKGETLNVIQGNYEITIVVSQKYLNELKNIFRKEKTLNIEKNLVSLTLTLDKDFIYTPGILALATRKLSWENINVFENISTMTELIFIIAEKDAVRAYNAFQEMLSEHKGK